MSGLDKLESNTEIINRDLEKNYSVIVEGLQTVMRKYGYSDSYEKFKDLTRTNNTITKERINNFISSLDITDECKMK